MEVIFNDTREDGVKTEEDGIKTEDGAKTKDGVEYFYIGDEYNNLIGKIFKFRLMDGDLHLTNFDNWKLGLIKMLVNI